MGNVCCTDRRKKAQEHPSPGFKTSKAHNQSPSKIPKTPKTPKTPNTSKTPIASPEHPQPALSRRNLKLPMPNDIVFNTLTPTSKNQINIVDFNESLVDELEYDITEAKDLSQVEQEKILHLFETFSNEVNEGEEEAFEGFSLVDIKNSESSSTQNALLISNCAVYILKNDDLNYVFRRIRLETIIVILLQDDICAMNLHMVSSELLGDLWIESPNIEDIHNCIQTMFRYITQRYIPTISYPESQFKIKFNNIPSTVVHFLTSEETVNVNNAIIQNGKIAENINFIKKGKTAHNGNFIDCIAVLTSKAFYCLEIDYKFVYRLDVKFIKALTITERADKIVIEKNNGDEILWMLNSKFITELEKVSMTVRQERLKIGKRKSIDISEYVQMSLRKKRPSYTMI
ncbi:hypothetical protein SteCoe_17335 [Stentor coeruleus]|uniref:TH1 domain-containing protein n=1 Tax=Stentor coeruleus TaxID=5963 RepID=A0A1R2BZ40_9CILI|nr:hypothetical protein SteCoe_17335 [Stentor coeruleus]